MTRNVVTQIEFTEYELHILNSALTSYRTALLKKRESFSVCSDLYDLHNKAFTVSGRLETLIAAKLTAIKNGEKEK